ncbi:MAG: hypothetical protein K2P08_07275, partial [Oscillospiraceae bacterium]|nr:hypothetical protein [Oscillospiraceae bacterium]
VFRPYVSFMLCGLPGHFPGRPLFDKLVFIFQFENFKFFADSIAQNAMPDYFHVGVVHHELDAKNIRINYTQAAITPAFAYFFL